MYTCMYVVKGRVMQNVLYYFIIWILNNKHDREHAWMDILRDSHFPLVNLRGCPFSSLFLLSKRSNSNFSNRMRFLFRLTMHLTRTFNPLTADLVYKCRVDSDVYNGVWEILFQILWLSRKRINIFNTDEQPTIF